MEDSNNVEAFTIVCLLWNLVCLFYAHNYVGTIDKQTQDSDREWNTEGGEVIDQNEPQPQYLCTSIEFIVFYFGWRANILNIASK